jgi:hypothetical protein
VLTIDVWKWAAVLAVLCLTACTDGAAPEPVEVPPVRTSTSQPEAIVPASGYRVDVLRLRAADLGSLPRLRSRLPRVIPDGTDLPSVLTDPPGTALVAYHPPEYGHLYRAADRLCDADDGSGWATETLLFLGADGRWRRLRLDELDLPDAAWPGGDTYGAGALSPDGRWWAGKSQAGVILIDLSTGGHRLVDLDTDWVAQIRWSADSRSFYAATHPETRGTLRTWHVTVPGLRRRVRPFELWKTGFTSSGDRLRLRGTDLGEAELVEWRRGDKVVRGRVSLPLFRPEETEMPHLSATGDRLAVATQQRRLDGEYGRRVDLVVVGAETLEPEAVLRFDQLKRALHDVWWWDPDTLLVATNREVLAWRPAHGTLLRVSDVPAAIPGCYWTVDVAVGAARPGSAGGRP